VHRAEDRLGSSRAVRADRDPTQSGPTARSSAGLSGIGGMLSAMRLNKVFGRSFVGCAILLTLLLASGAVFTVLAASPRDAGAQGSVASAERLMGAVSQRAEPSADRRRPRVIVTSDFPPVDVIPGRGCPGPPDRCSDPDDVQSMVRFLLYTNEFDVEGLVASAATFANVANKTNILDILDLYDQVDEHLRKRDARYPTADRLRAVTWEGRSRAWNRPADEILGDGKDSEASDAIIRVVDRSDPRPVWVCVWGGPREVAQAIWKVRQTRSPAELERFLGKLRIYMIGLGDRPGQDGSGQWLLDQFPKLFVIVSQRTYHGMFAQKTPIGDLQWLNAHIREGYGPLGAAYPRSGFDPDQPGVQEGDTPSFLHLVSAVRGLNDPEQPDQESWGGQFVRRDPAKHHWFDGPGPQSVSKWLPAIQEDFATRAKWMLP
jgi:hypothetical protein